MYRLLIKVGLGFDSSEARDGAYDKALAMLNSLPGGVTRQGSLQTWEEVEVSGTYIERQNIQTEKIV